MSTTNATAATLPTFHMHGQAWGAPEATLSSETVEYAVVFFGGYMTKTVNEEDGSLLDGRLVPGSGKCTSELGEYEKESNSRIGPISTAIPKFRSSGNYKDLPGRPSEAEMIPSRVEGQEVSPVEGNVPRSTRIYDGLPKEFEINPSGAKEQEISPVERGMVKLIPDWDVVVPSLNLELLNYRIEPESISFQPERLKTVPPSSEVEFSELAKPQPPRNRDLTPLIEQQTAETESTLKERQITLRPGQEKQVTLSGQESVTSVTSVTAESGSNQDVSGAQEVVEAANGAQNEPVTLVTPVTLSEANQGRLDAKPALDRDHEAAHGTLPSVPRVGRSGAARRGSLVNAYGVGAR